MCIRDSINAEYMGIYIGYLVFQALNDSIKTGLLTLLGVISEDDSFDSSNLYSRKRRFVKISDLSESGFIRPNDENLKRKLARVEGALKINIKDHRKARLRILWQRALWTVIYAMRNKIQAEKDERAAYYTSLFKKKKNDSDDEDDPKHNSKNGINTHENVDPEDADRPPYKNMHSQSQSEGHKGEREVGSVEEFAERPPSNLNEHHASSHNSDQHESSSHLTGGPSGSHGRPVYNPINADDEEYSLKCPSGLWRKIIFVVYFPVNLILYFVMPDFRRNPSTKRVGVTVIVSIFCISILNYFAVTFIKIVALGLGISVHAFFLAFGGITSSLAYIHYNISAAIEGDRGDLWQTITFLNTFKLLFYMPLALFLFDLLNSSTILYLENGYEIPILMIIVVCVVSFFVAVQKFKVHPFSSVIFIAAFGAFIVISYIWIDGMKLAQASQSCQLQCLSLIHI
eukprot:TRINITY_DN1805_c0_g1_i2.p1 TRINITY_DN1805_c0_g1~~TRINITY_DN1805_c0_g1_i2.p1  ORF type:complete len:457 (+),score=91.57 TRINITY_DN1805_c0_g1_i2:66-1436(+)